ncbi:MAG: nuclease-related domain-containing protein [Nitrospirota bacterium]
MAIEKGEPGRNGLRRARNYHFGKNMVMIICVLTLAGIVYTMFDSASAGLGTFAVLAIGFKAMWSHMKKEMRFYEEHERRESKGARAEEQIGALLRELSDDHVVFHDIKSPYGNIDHVIINEKNQVFLIETKSHHGEVTREKDKLLVNHKMPEKDFISQAVKNTFWLKKAIEEKASSRVFITSMVVFTNASVRITGPLKKILVINKNDLLKTIADTPHRSARSLTYSRLFEVIADLQGKKGGALPHLSFGSKGTDAPTGTQVQQKTT